MSFIDRILKNCLPSIRIDSLDHVTRNNSVVDANTYRIRGVLANAPDWVALELGIFGSGPCSEQADAGALCLSDAEYAQNLEQLLAATRSELEGIVLLSPYLTDLEFDESTRARIDACRSACQAMAEKYDCLYVDCQKAVDDMMTFQQPLNAPVERIHSSPTTQMAIAMAFLKVIGFAFDPVRLSWWTGDRSHRSRGRQVGV